MSLVVFLLSIYGDIISTNPLWEFWYGTAVAIGKELGVDHRTIGRWLSENDGAAKQGILPKDLNNGHNVLSTATNSRYLVGDTKQFNQARNFVCAILE